MNIFVYLVAEFVVEQKRKKLAHPKASKLFNLKIRRLPTLPHWKQCSTIGSKRLNYRVRDGNGCDPLDKITGKLKTN